MIKYFVIPSLFYILIKEENDEIDDSIDKSIELLDYLFNGLSEK